MTLCGTALNLINSGEGMKTYLQLSADILIWLFHVVIFQTTGTKWTKVKKRKCSTCKIIVFAQ